MTFTFKMFRFFFFFFFDTDFCEYERYSFDICFHLSAFSVCFILWSVNRQQQGPEIMLFGGEDNWTISPGLFRIEN